MVDEETAGSAGLGAPPLPAASEFRADQEYAFLETPAPFRDKST